MTKASTAYQTQIFALNSFENVLGFVSGSSGGQWFQGLLLQRVLKRCLFHSSVWSAVSGSPKVVLCSSFSKDESRAPKPGVWLMRGAQPATSDGARLCAGSPIPALFTTPQRVVKKSILSLLYLLSGEHFRIGRYSARKSTHLSCECFANPSIHRDG